MLGNLLTADRVLLGGLVDYAGLFPPASLGMEDAVAEYREARRGAHAWMLGRFICPASRLEELAGELTTTMEAGEQSWPVSVILDGDTAAAATAAYAFGAEMEPAASVVLVEVRLPAATAALVDEAAAVHAIATLVTAALSVSAVATPFFEVVRGPAWQSSFSAIVAAIDAHRRRVRRPMGVKLRCGGLEPSAFPSVHEVATLVVESAAVALPMKATAGLHHPIRHHDEQLDLMRHGFLNLVVASALAATGAGIDEVARVVEETDPDAFALSAAGVEWGGHHFGTQALQALRAERFASYGSCSFAEPVEDLIALGWVKPG